MPDSLLAILQILIILVVPYFFIRFAKRSKYGSFLSPIVLCFALGILICNLRLFSVNEQISEIIRDGSIVFALPLLLYSSNIREWIQSSKEMLISFGLCLLAGFIATFIATQYFASKIENVWQISGMLTGIFTGGTANLFAVGLALEAPNEDMVLLNTAEIFWGAIYLLFLLSVAKPIWNKVLPKSKIGANSWSHPGDEPNIRVIDVVKGLGLTTIIIVLVAGISMLLFGVLKSDFIIIGITTFGIIASLNISIRSWSGTFETGDYMLLMFGLSIGMISDFSVLVENGGLFIAYTGMVMIITVVLHALFCKWKNIDTDTYLITSAAALYGPVFIGQVASALKNRNIIVGGLIVSLIGLAIGTYLGIGVAYFVKYFI